jgi:hypothetical protein
MVAAEVSMVAVEVLAALVVAGGMAVALWRAPARGMAAEMLDAATVVGAAATAATTEMATATAALPSV